MANNCQVPTPKEYVKNMLDYIGYDEKLYGKRVLENSCGEGNILVEIVERYILDTRRLGYTTAEIVNGLETDVCAYEIDPERIKKCIERLNKLANRYEVKNVKWNIKNEDYLEASEQDFQYIIGNPPYITYHGLSEEKRTFLKETFDSCKEGRFDYSYAFIEASLNSLAPDGKMVYLVPYSIMKNKFAKQLRMMLRPYITDIYDYKAIKVFPEATTSAIMILCKNRNDIYTMNYTTVSTNMTLEVDKSQLEDKWSFGNSKTENQNKSKFEDYFEIYNSVATLCNDAFVLKKYSENKTYYIIGEYKVEKKIVKNAASTKSFNRRKNNKGLDKIIFPYKHDNKGVSHYSQDEFCAFFPEANKYIKQYIEKLGERKADKQAQWFEYGRSQAISKVFGEKLIIPMVITKSVTVYHAEEEDVPYAGYFIKRKEGSPLTLDDAKKILESQQFYNYVKEQGTPTTPTSYRISVNDIKAFRIDDVV